MTGLPEEIRLRAPSLGDGRYRLVELIERGLLTQTYRAFDTRIDLFRAVQVLSSTYASDARIRGAFVAQSSELVSFHHDNVVRVVDVQPRGPLPWLVIDDHFGPSVEEHLGLNGALTPRQAVRVLRQALIGLQALHDTGFPHLDLQPRSLLLGPEGAVTLSPPSVHWLLGSALTEVEVRGYTAPELRRDPERRSGAADLYGVGATLYAMFVVDDPPDFLYELVDDDSELEPIPEVFRPIVRECCALRPEDRPRSPRSVVEQLVRAAQAAGPDPGGTPGLLRPPASLTLPVAPSFPELQPILDPAGSPASPPSTSTVEVVWRRAEAFDEVDDDSNDVTVEATPMPYRLARARRDELEEWMPGRRRINPDSLPMYVDRDAVLRQAEVEEAEEGRREVVTPAGVAATETPASAPAAYAPTPAPPAGRDARTPSVSPDPVRSSRARTRASPPPARPERSRRGEPSLVRWALLGGGVGLALFAVALVMFGMVVGGAALSLRQARQTTDRSRALLYQTILDHESEIAALGSDVHAEHVEWVGISGEPARIEAALDFLDHYARAARPSPSGAEAVRRTERQDTARRFAASREAYRGALEEWRSRAGTFTGRTAIAFGMASRPPEDDPEDRPASRPDPTRPSRGG